MAFDSRLTVKIGPSSLSDLGRGCLKPYQHQEKLTVEDRIRGLTWGSCAVSQINTSHYFQHIVRASSEPDDSAEFAQKATRNFPAFPIKLL